MKAINRLFVLLLLAVVGLSAINTASASEKTVLNVAAVPVGELDPAKASDYADSILMFNVYDTLVLPKKDDVGYQPYLAKSWSVDGLNYTFELRDDVMFASGNPLTAEDVVFSFKRMVAIGQGLSFLFSQVQSVKAIDAHTVRFHLKAPYAPFLSTLVRLPILDKELVMKHLGEGDEKMKDWGQGWLSSHSAGTGAYEVVAHNPISETILIKNENYFLGVPDEAPEEVHISYGLSAATMRAMLATGKLDITTQWLPPEVLRAMVDDGAKLLTEILHGGFYIKMNTAKPPLDDVNCRRALASAYNYAAGIHVVSVTDKVAKGSRSTGAIPVGMLGSNPSSQKIEQDLKTAKKYLSACEYDPSEFTIDISWVSSVPVERRFALLMQSNFSQIGIKSEIKKVPWSLFTQLVAKPETTPDISQIFVPSVTGGVDALLWAMYHSSSAGSWQAAEYLKNDKVDRLLKAGRSTTDVDKREKIYSKLNHLLMKIAPTIYAFDQLAVFAATDRVEAPGLSGEPSKEFGVAGLGFMFRTMTVDEK